MDKLYAKFPNLAPTPPTDGAIEKLLDAARKTVDANNIAGQPLRGNGKTVGEFFGAGKSVYCLIVNYEYHLMLGQNEYVTRDPGDAHRSIAEFINQ